MLRSPRDEVETVQHIHLAHTSVKVQEQKVHIWIDILYLFLYTLGNDVIGDTSERLQTDGSIDAVFCE